MSAFMPISDALLKKIEAKTFAEHEIAPLTADELHHIGYTFDVGKGVSQNFERARQWYQRARAKGCALSSRNLGILYRNGEGVSVDKAEAAYYFQEAYERGDEKSQEILKRLLDAPETTFHDLSRIAHHSFVEGRHRNYQLSRRVYGKLLDQGGSPVDFKWFLGIAARMGGRNPNSWDAIAYMRMGIMYSSPLHPDRDFYKAWDYFRKGAREGRTDAREYIRRLFDDPLNSNSESLSASIGLTWFLGGEFRGVELEQDYVMARQWLQRAVSQGDDVACYYLGIIYAQGKGTETDALKADMYFRMGAERGCADCKAMLYQEVNEEVVVQPVQKPVIPDNHPAWKQPVAAVKQVQLPPAPKPVTLPTSDEDLALAYPLPDGETTPFHRIEKRGERVIIWTDKPSSQNIPLPEAVAPLKAPEPAVPLPVLLDEAKPQPFNPPPNGASPFPPPPLPPPPPPGQGISKSVLKLNRSRERLEQLIEDNSQDENTFKRVMLALKAVRPGNPEEIAEKTALLARCKTHLTELMKVHVQKDADDIATMEAAFSALVEKRKDVSAREAALLQTQKSDSYQDYEKRHKVIHGLQDSIVKRQNELGMYILARKKMETATYVMHQGVEHKCIGTALLLPEVFHLRLQEIQDAIKEHESVIEEMRNNLEIQKVQLATRYPEEHAYRSLAATLMETAALNLHLATKVMDSKQALQARRVEAARYQNQSTKFLEGGDVIIEDPQPLMNAGPERVAIDLNAVTKSREALKKTPRLFDRCKSMPDLVTYLVEEAAKNQP